MIPPEPDMPHDSPTPPPASPPSSVETWQLLENLPLPVLIASLHENARVLFLNRQFTATFGYTIEDIPTKEDWARLAYPDPAYRNKVFTRWNTAEERAIRELGSVEAMEFKVTAKDGTLRDTLFHATVLGDNLQLTLTDLTARRTAERELVSTRKELERTAYEVTQNIPVGTYTMVLPPGGAMAKFSFMSSRFLELCGLERQAAEENPFNAFACVHPEDHAEWVRKNAESFEKKIPFSEECRVVANGVTRWIHAESVPRDLPDGSIVWEGVLTDISRRKTAEAELAKREETLRQTTQRMQLAAEAAGIGFWTRDLQSHLEEWDAQMLCIYGLQPGEFDGRWEPHVHPEDLERVQRETQQTIESQNRGHYEYRIVRPDGSIRFLCGLSTILHDAEGRSTHEIGVNYDITLQKQAVEALARVRQQERQTEVSHRRKLEQKLRISLTAAAVAHEINQPLSRILLTSQLVMDNSPAESAAPGKLHSHLLELSTEAQRVVATIEKMKSLIRNTETAHAPLDLREIIDSAILYAGPFAREADTRISFHRPARAARLLGDADQLQIALNNLLRNAIESLIETPPQAPRDIRVYLRSLKHHTELVIEDSGPGYHPPDPDNTLFNSTKAQGTGLGLFIVQTTMENHGGRLEIDRSPLGGAAFHMVFPKGEAQI